MVVLGCLLVVWCVFKCLFLSLYVLFGEVVVLCCLVLIVFPLAAVGIMVFT